MNYGEIVLGIDAWLETMRGLEGYGGPVAHWWGDCLDFTGSGLDWRYEGIISAYLSLYERTGQARWLEKAQCAGDDLIRGQLPSGNYRNSSFEGNPKSGGTPHEAACDVALFSLARTLKVRSDPAWGSYASAAERNLESFILGQLWSGTKQAPVRNHSGDSAFVPNKAATVLEALLGWVSVGGPAGVLERYGLPILDAILACQYEQTGSKLDGAIRQSTTNSYSFPFYIARCIPALVKGALVSGSSRYRRAAEEAMRFILRHQYPDGSFPQVISSAGRVYRYPQWVAGVGDILRAMEALGLPESESGFQSAMDWMMRGARPSGAIACAQGFARRGITRFGIVLWRTELPDWRDLLPVCGWIDKAFRFLTQHVTSIDHDAEFSFEKSEYECLYQGKPAVYLESKDRISVSRKGKTVYLWRKGDPRPELLL